MLRLMADVWGVPVAARDIVEEANAIGAAVVAGVGAGIFDSFETATRLSHRGADHEPDAARHEAYREPYARFLDAYRHIEPWFDTV